MTRSMPGWLARRRARKLADRCCQDLLDRIRNDPALVHPEPGSAALRLTGSSEQASGQLAGLLRAMSASMADAGVRQFLQQEVHAHARLLGIEPATRHIPARDLGDNPGRYGYGQHTACWKADSCMLDHTCPHWHGCKRIDGEPTPSGPLAEGDLVTIEGPDGEQGTSRITSIEPGPDGTITLGLEP